MSDEIKIKKAKSSLAEFTKKPVPGEKEVEEFEEYVEDELREEEIEESLSEIYQDDDGNMVDVSKLSRNKKKGFLFWFFSFVFFVVFFGGGGYIAWQYLNSHTDAKVDFYIDGPSEVLAGEEFFYVINYKNDSNIAIKNVDIEIKYPDNFIILDVSSAGEERGGSWHFDEISPYQQGKIKIKGKIIAPQGENNIILANMLYTPANFSSEFKKESSLSTTIKDIGIDFDFDYVDTVLVGEENEIVIKYSAQEENYLYNFRVVVEPLDNLEFIKEDLKDENIEMIRPGVWQVNLVSKEEQELPIYYKLTDKISNEEVINIKFSQADKEGNYYNFFEKSIKVEAMENDLNLTLIVNGKRTDQGVDFGQVLNYSIVYINKGETSLKNVVVMAVLESDFLDWTSLDDKNNGQRKGNTIIWTKEEIPQLEELKPEDEGSIDFSIKLIKPDKIESGKEYLVKSYAQFSVGEIEGEEARATKSNVIINKINSDLNLIEEIRYFNKDNIPVGTGPIPPKVNKTTSFKVYWTIKNSLHELKSVKVYVSLPQYVSWAGKEHTSVGDINYDIENHRVVWEIGRLPITVLEANAEFSISITPLSSDVGKVLVLSPGATIKAIDKETGAEIKRTTQPKTTKLEDDDIANSDGIVVD